MIYKPKNRRYYAVKFMHGGRLIQKRTRATTAKDARAIEAKLRSELARGNFGILEVRPRTTLADFLRRDFLPYVEANCAAKPETVKYYQRGARSLLPMDFAALPLDEITDQHGSQFAARYAHTSASNVNCGLRTLRRALHLADEWGRLSHAPHISLAKGERQRDRVLADAEITGYLSACPQPWLDCAVVMLGTGMRPGEVFRLRWEHVLLNGHGGMIQIVEGKSKAARRLLPMVPAVWSALKSRNDAQGAPAEGWVFPSGSRSGHLGANTTKNQHRRALVASGVKPFEPYCLRHTALTRLAESGCDAFTLARIAGHSSISITQRYCHPQAEAVEAAFRKLAASGQLVTDGGYHALQAESDNAAAPALTAGN